jgi:hypothetical protein
MTSDHIPTLADRIHLIQLLHDKLAGDEPLAAVVRWWRGVALDGAGYLNSFVTDEQLDQLTDIELAVSELASIQRKNDVFGTRSLSVDLDDPLSPWKELEEAREVLRYRRRRDIEDYEQAPARAQAELDQQYARAVAEYAASFDEGQP